MSPRRADGITVEEAGPAALADLIPLFIELQEFERAFEPNRLPGADCAEDHLAALFGWIEESRQRGDPAGVLLARDADGAPLGFIVFGVEEEFGRYVLPENQRFGLISDLVVTEAARGRGLGGRLARAVERRFVEAGFHRLEISVLAQNTAAREAYAALGFKHQSLTLAKTLR